MDTLKEAVDTIFYRAKSPLFGSIILSFVAWNWKPFVYLIWADRPIRARFLYFEQNIDVMYPLLIGLLLFAIAPIGKLLGSVVAEYPTHLMRMRQLKYDNLYETRKLQLENKRNRVLGEAEQQLIEQAKRDIEVEAIPEDKREGLQKQIDELRTSSQDAGKLSFDSMSGGDEINLSPTSVEIIFAIGQSKSAEMSFLSTLEGRVYSISDWNIDDNKSKRDFAKFRSAAVELEAQNYIENMGGKGHFFELTNKGYNIYEKLQKYDFKPNFVGV